MTAADLLERPGRWRAPALSLGIAFAFGPPLLLVIATAGGSAPAADWLGSGFALALWRSLAVGAAVAALALAIGLPAGTLVALYAFPLRRVLLSLLALPLLLSSFVPALGFSALRIEFGLSRDSWLSGFSGTTLSFLTAAIPLVLFVTMTSMRAISQRQADAARLAGGEAALLVYAMRATLPSASLAGVLAGVGTLADPGPGQILGYPGAGFEILASFAAQFDFALAARQCVAVAAAVLACLGVATLLLVWSSGARGFAPFAALLTRQAEPVSPAMDRRALWLGPALLAGMAGTLLLLPLLGFVGAASRDPRWSEVLATARRTVADTAFFSVGAALIAVVLGTLLAICAGRRMRLRAVLFAAMIILFALPPALSALGWIYAGSVAPASADPLLRSRITVALQLGFRTLPVAALVAIRAIAALPPAWAEAAALHGIGLLTFTRRIFLPAIIRALCAAAMLSALLALADVGSVLLVAPPGAGSFPLAIFTVMANAPESLVASLCVGYVAAMATVLATGWQVLQRAER